MEVRVLDALKIILCRSKSLLSVSLILLILSLLECLLSRLDSTLSLNRAICIIEVHTLHDAIHQLRITIHSQEARQSFLELFFVLDLCRIKNFTCCCSTSLSILVKTLCSLLRYCYSFGGNLNCVSIILRRQELCIIKAYADLLQSFGKLWERRLTDYHRKVTSTILDLIAYTYSDAEGIDMIELVDSSLWETSMLSSVLIQEETLVSHFQQVYLAITIHTCSTCCCQHSCSLNSCICIVTTIVVILSNFYVAFSILFCHFDNVFKCYLLKLINTFLGN